ncbi:hypothetical protein ACJMK2_017852, partial [Sinanodonta woodiana]
SVTTAISNDLANVVNQLQQLLETTSVKGPTSAHIVEASPPLPPPKWRAMKTLAKGKGKPLTSTPKQSPRVEIDLERDLEVSTSLED